MLKWKVDPETGTQTAKCGPIALKLRRSGVHKIFLRSPPMDATKTKLEAWMEKAVKAMQRDLAAKPKDTLPMDGKP